MLKIALVTGLTLFATMQAAQAQVPTSCTQAYQNCMGGFGSRDNSPERGAACQRTKAQCLRTGNWQNRFQNLTNLRKE